MNDDRKTWKFKAADGRFRVWHAGKNLYYVTDDKDGSVVGSRQHFGQAFALASHYQRLAKYEGAAA